MVDLNSMTEEELAALIEQMTGLGAIPDEQGLLNQQMAQGQGMMNTPSAQGQNVGQTYVASSPLEHLSVALQRAKGGRQQNQAQQDYKATLGKQSQGRMAGAQMDPYIQALIQEIKKRNEPPPGLGLDLSGGY